LLVLLIGLQKENDNFKITGGSRLSFFPGSAIGIFNQMLLTISKDALAQSPEIIYGRKNVLKS
jgi:hypothetical protein